MARKKTQLSIGLMGVALLGLGGLGVGQAKAESLDNLKERMEEHVKKLERSSRSANSDETRKMEKELEEMYLKMVDQEMKENKIMEKIDNLSVVPDKTERTRARHGRWTWRDGVIAVTNNGISGSWHAGIVAPQKSWVTAESSPKTGVKLQYNFEGRGTVGKYNVWQTGVKSTTVSQDWHAGHWAGRQVGKPYNYNFYKTNNRNSFYCSQLIWAAYMDVAKVNLNTSAYDIPGARAIHPSELLYNNKVQLIYRAK